MTVWFILLGLMLAIEIFALATKERYILTLSRTTWRLLGFEDRSFDRQERWTRMIYGVILGIFFLWLWIHLVLGPCAWGIC